MARSEVVNVFAEQLTQRLQWIFKLIFEEMLGTQILLTKDPDHFADNKAAALNYSHIDLPGIPCIRPHGLLEETGIQEQDIDVDNKGEIPVFFQVDGGDLGYDPFAMAFYLVSRYEEYLPFKADQHGRFTHTESLAFKSGFLDIPLVNHLAEQIRELLIKHYPELSFSLPSYSFLPTVDVDIAYAHLGKGFVRTWGAMAKLLLGGKVKEISQRLKTMRGKSEDPYDNFDFLNEAFLAKNLKSIFFILAGDPGPHDRNLSVKHPRVADLLKGLAQQTEIGIHPSYRSGDQPEMINKEIQRLGETVGKEIKKSRQHYVRMKFPDTYRILIENGIKEDYSMGFASISGFRASIASPFSFYDLERETASDLRVYPFMFMDSTLEDYMHLEAKDYAAAVKPIIEKVKACNGSLCGIWHNYAMADDKKKKQAFLDILKLASAK